MNLEHSSIAVVIGYSCLFIGNPDDAIFHIFSLINQNTGFEKDKYYYRDCLTEMISSYPLLQLNICGRATFSESQWRYVLQGVVDALNGDLKTVEFGK